MSGLETAIRSALEQADRDNPEVRARIYQSARQALEAGLRKQDITDPQAVAAHRHRLEGVIHAIEAEERQRNAPPLPQAAVPIPPEVTMPEPLPKTGSADRRVSAEGEARSTSFAADRQDAAAFDGLHAERTEQGHERADHLDMSPADDRQVLPRTAASTDFRPERAAVRRKPRKFFSRLLLLCLLLAFAGIGVWWVRSSGLLLSPAQRDTSVANPPASTAPEDYDGTDNAGAGQQSGTTIDPQNNFSQEWTQIFQPADSAKLIKGAAVQMQSVTEAEGPAVRLVSQDPGRAGSVGVPVPADVLARMQGKPSTIAVTLQASTDSPTQITIECDFSSLGDCARHRFRVTRQKQDVLLQVRFAEGAKAGDAGTLFINSDVDGQRNGIDLYAVRVLPEQ